MRRLQTRLARTGVAACAALGAALFLLPALASAQSTSGFDHFRTRFPLSGAHERVSCEGCHGGGAFAGTPTRCETCHDGSGLRSDSSKGVMHIRSTNQCDDCHLLAAWVPSRIDHAAVLGSCGDCHNGIVAPGKSLGHTQSSNQCEACHRSATWTGARFNHSGLTGSCFSCHNGSTARGKHSGHIRSGNVCEQCHQPGSWSNVHFDHTGTTGSCASCHNGTDATGMDSGHFLTSLDCGTCHVQTRWTPSTFRHTGADYPGDHAGRLACGRCHGGNSESVTWRTPTYRPDCAGCHANDFERDEHKKVDSPRILYSVSELRDCAGACHQYTDSNFNTIKKFRSGEHRARDGDF
jgi:hypothetical protein